ncbi:hypothetical protein [Kineococcus xinjiangensis]|uniref:hypothetical protein n=1 Tax=Kineococcus xinjiangensis TaxID=512762 RepID=UPI000CEC1511|nr:hypothetical protein [Kineococcus xinjiangensis]
MPGTRAPRPAATSPAEWARTLAAGTVAGTLHLARTAETEEAGCAATRRTEPFPVRHLSGAGGDLLLLVDDGSPLATRLDELRAGLPDGHDVPAVLDVLDVPPGLSGLPRARLCVTGWIDAVPAAEQRRLAATATSPTPALLDIGRGRHLLRLDVADLRVTTGGGVHLVTDDDYVAATPDPLYGDEHEIVAHLEAHHRDRLIGWVLHRLPREQARQVREVAVVGADRHGIDVLCTLSETTVTLRGAFATPVTAEHHLPRALCGLFACPCEGASAH